uniref:Uncharacterized protein n=1 Tax=viral metagenome TaxID=1070528 RepID=A0A6H2A0P6_9ZZZZ
MTTKELTNDKLIITGDATLGEVCAIQAKNRQTLIAYINAFVGSSFFDGKENKTYLSVALSGSQLGCEGCSANFATEADVPYQSVPCSCGNPKHWLIKYEQAG